MLSHKTLLCIQAQGRVMDVREVHEGVRVWVSVDTRVHVYLVLKPCFIEAD